MTTPDPYIQALLQGSQAKATLVRDQELRAPADAFGPTGPTGYFDDADEVGGAEA